MQTSRSSRPCSTSRVRLEPRQTAVGRPGQPDGTGRPIRSSSAEGSRADSRSVKSSRGAGSRPHRRTGVLCVERHERIRADMARLEALVGLTDLVCRVGARRPGAYRQSRRRSAWFDVEHLTERRESLGWSGPVFSQLRGSCLAQQSMEDERCEDRVVGVSDHREKVGNEVDGHGEICRSAQAGSRADRGMLPSLARRATNRTVSGSILGSPRSVPVSGRAITRNTRNTSQSARSTRCSGARVATTQSQSPRTDCPVLAWARTQNHHDLTRQCC